MKLTQTFELPSARKQLSQEQLEALFDKICNKDNWKNEINAIIKESEFNDYNDACVHFTGGVLDIIETDGENALVHSEGYYYNIGA